MSTCTREAHSIRQHAFGRVGEQETFCSASRIRDQGAALEGRGMITVGQICAVPEGGGMITLTHGQRWRTPMRGDPTPSKTHGET